MKKILFLVPYPENKAPSQRLKFEQYFDHIKDAGYEITIHSFIDESFWEILYTKGNLLKKILFSVKAYFKRYLFLFKIRKFDIVYCHLWMTPHGYPVYERLAILLSKSLIFDIDDLIFLGHSSNANRFFQFLKGRNKTIYLMKKSDHVITCTPHLDSFVRKFNINTTDISSTINTETYIPINKYLNNKKLVVGWSGSHSTSKYVHILGNVLKDISSIYNIEIHIIGDQHFQIRGLSNLKAYAWKEEDEVERLQKFDIGIYPLPDEEWVLGKSGLKALQYMALGIPTIATAIGANYRVIENEVSGILVKNEDEWKEALIRYIENPELRKEHGTEARKRVEKYYSIKANAPKYLQILKNLKT